MKNLYSYCGFDCSKCPVYVATINNDYNLKMELVKKYNTEENPLTIEDIKCLGCKNKKILFKYCYECKIRNIGINTK
ncbi:hypothetical protein JCM30566_13270 [Marinitoga arctica]